MLKLFPSLFTKMSLNFFSLERNKEFCIKKILKFRIYISELLKMISSMLLWTGITLILYGIYKWITANDKFFEKRGIPYLKPTLLFGNTINFVFQTISLPDFAQKLYASYPNKKLVKSDQSILKCSVNFK